MIIVTVTIAIVVTMVVGRRNRPKVPRCCRKRRRDAAHRIQGHGRACVRRVNASRTRQIIQSPEIRRLFDGFPLLGESIDGGGTVGLMCSGGAFEGKWGCHRAEGT